MKTTGLKNNNNNKINAATVYNMNLKISEILLENCSMHVFSILLKRQNSNGWECKIYCLLRSIYRKKSSVFEIVLLKILFKWCYNFNVNLKIYLWNTILNLVVNPFNSKLLFKFNFKCALNKIAFVYK